MPKRMRSRYEQYHFCVPSVSFLVKSPFVIISISSLVTFQIFDVLMFVKRLCTAFKNFHVKNVCIMTSG